MHARGRVHRFWGRALPGDKVRQGRALSATLHEVLEVTDRMRLFAPSMAGPRIFTVDQANALLPRLNFVVGAQLQRRDVIDRKLQTLAAWVGEAVPALAIRESDSDDTRQLKRDLTERITEYQSGWEELESMGGVVKDARLGLVDFYGRVDGKLVWLCWKYGEDRIDHYHALSEGFSSRKRIAERVQPTLPN